MSQTIRPIAPSDRVRWAELWRGYLDFYQTKLPESQYGLQFSRLTDPEQTTYTGLVAERPDGALVGLAHCIWHGHGWTVAPVCYLQDLFTAPDQRGTGIGRALIEAVYEHADAGKAAGVYWMTQDFNTGARALYDRIGRLTPFIKYERGA